MFERFKNTAEKSNFKVVTANEQVHLPSSVKDEDHILRQYTDLKIRLHEELLDILNLKALEKVERDEFSKDLEPILKNLLAKMNIALNADEFSGLLAELLDEVLGLGPIEPFLKDDSVSDILVNTYQDIYVERYGRVEETTAHFKDDRHLMRIIQKIVSHVGRRVDESQPWVDARLPDGSRVNALVPPCAVDGPLLSIRKFAKIPYTIEGMIENGSMTPQIAQFLNAVVSSRLNVLVSGGTGSGKTTMLNALSSFISHNERIMTIEDTAELQLQQKHVGRMETRPANSEGTGEVAQRDLVRNALRMRPDRIIVGEVRGAEVLDMLQAMNTGHDGSMTTIHSNSPRDALTRLEHMIGMSGVEIPLKSLRSQISSAINIVVQIQRLSDGRRKVMSIQEITGMEGDIVSMQEIFQFNRMGVDENGKVIGEHCATGVRPKCMQRISEAGVSLPENLFAK